MTHKDAPPRSIQQTAMEVFYNDLLALSGATVGWSRNKTGDYEAIYAKNAWAAWQAAQRSLWQPMSSAPLDGTVVDLLCEATENPGLRIRIANAAWEEGDPEYGWKCEDAEGQPNWIGLSVLDGFIDWTVLFWMKNVPGPI